MHREPAPWLRQTTVRRRIRPPAFRLAERTGEVPPAGANPDRYPGRRRGAAGAPGGGSTVGQHADLRCVVSGPGRGGCRPDHGSPAEIEYSQARSAQRGIAGAGRSGPRGAPETGQPRFTARYRQRTGGAGARKNSFGVSQFMETARYQHALEGELARSIMTIGSGGSRPDPSGVSQGNRVRPPATTSHRLGPGKVASGPGAGPGSGGGHRPSDRVGAFPSSDPTRYR
ncbi:MAG: hypothetical protein MZV70_44030 [Desulfobacterales bacterium]|nr:hypothetical protein [Desulfobacterales bacterium]